MAQLGYLKNFLKKDNILNMKKLTLIFFLSISTLVFSQQYEYEYEIFNTSVNSKDAELGVTYLNSKTVLFASSKKTEEDNVFSKNRRQNNRQLYIELYQGLINENGDIIQMGKFSKEANNMFFISAITFSKDLKTTYFTWNNYYYDTSRKDSTKWKTLRVVKASINQNYEVSNITQLPFSSEDYSIMQPELSDDGKQLYFVSDMPKGFGETDIYVVDINPDGTFGTPKNLGPNVNTPYSEAFPFITENTLYFSSYGHNSKGGLDTFKSELKSGEFQKSAGLPDPINTKYDDFAFVIDSNTNSGFFSSDRKKGVGDADIYGFSMIEKEIECLQLITGVILNETTKKPISNAVVSIFQNNELINSVITSKTGNYSFDLKCNETYKITTEKEYFISAEFDFETDNTLDFEVKKDLILTEIECNQIISGTITNALTNELLESITLKLYKNGEVIATKTTLSDGFYNFDINCNDNYTLIAEKYGFSPSEIKLKTNNEYDAEVTKKIALSPLDCNQLITGTVTNKETGEQLINVALKLYQNTNLITTGTLNNDSKFRLDLKCNETYTITAEKEGYHATEIEVSTDALFDKNITTNLELVPVECNQLISGVISNKTTGEPIINTSLKLFSNNVLINTINADGSNYTFDVDCSSSYKIVAEKEGFENFEIELQSDTRNDYNHENNMQLIPVECNQVIKGILVDESSRNQLNNATISLFENGVLKEEITLRNLEFQFNITCNKFYKMVVEKANYKSTEIELSTNEINDFKIEKIINLSPLKCTQTVSAIIKDKNTDQLLPNAKILVFKNDVLIKNVILDSTAMFNVELECNRPHKILVSTINHQNNEWIIDATSNYNESINKTIYLNPKEIFETIGNIKIIKTDPIYFDLDRSEISTIAIIELDKIIEIMNEYPLFKIKVKTHTDSRAPDDYNLKLSDKRAQSIINYIVSKGVDSNRITGKGYGETELLNKCTNGVKCSEEEHRINRRTEFIIIEN